MGCTQVKTFTLLQLDMVLFKKNINTSFATVSLHIYFFASLLLQKFCIQETLNLLIDADSGTNIYVSASFKKGADSNLF